MSSLNNQRPSFFSCQVHLILCLNPFIPNALFLYPLKTSENLTVCWCFQGVEKGCIGNEWVNIHQNDLNDLKKITSIIIWTNRLIMVKNPLHVFVKDQGGGG